MDDTLIMMGSVQGVLDLTLTRYPRSEQEFALLQACGALCTGGEAAPRHR